MRSEEVRKETALKLIGASTGAVLLVVARVIIGEKNLPDIQFMAYCT